MVERLNFEVHGNVDYFLSSPFEELDLRVEEKPWELAGELVQALRDFGPFHQGLVSVQPGVAGNLSFVQVTIPRADNQAMVSYRADRLDVLWLRPPPSVAAAGGLLHGLLATPWSSKPFVCARFDTVIACHGLVSGGAANFLSRFTGILPDLGPYAGAGLRMRYGPDGPRLRSIVELDLSVSISDGLYLRLDCGWDAKGVSVASLAGAVIDYQQAVLHGLGLSTEWKNEKAS